MIDGVTFRTLIMPAHAFVHTSRSTSPPLRPFRFVLVQFVSPWLTYGRHRRLLVRYWGVPIARVVRIPNADHYVFESNETDVLREMNMFIARLK